MRTKEEIKKQIEERKKMLAEEEKPLFSNPHNTSWLQGQINILEWVLEEEGTAHCAQCNDSYKIKELKDYGQNGGHFYVCKNCLDYAKDVGRRK